jgi:hypothetical protein
VEGAHQHIGRSPLLYRGIDFQLAIESSASESKRVFYYRVDETWHMLRHQPNLPSDLDVHYVLISLKQPIANRGRRLERQFSTGQRRYDFGYIAPFGDRLRGNRFSLVAYIYG